MLQLYTPGAFTKFKEQLCTRLSFKVDSTSSFNENVLSVVYIGESPKKCWRRDAYDYEVNANIADCEFSCVCKLFDHLGILCSHILMVSMQYNLYNIC